jgi:DNA-binding CsgD family transcriptional regulator
MVTTDAEGRIVRWGPDAQSLLGYKAAQVMGRVFLEVVQARDVFGNRVCPRACGLLAMVRLGESVRTFEMEVETASGGRTRVFASVTLESSARNRERLAYQLRADLRRQDDRRRTADRRSIRAAAASKALGGESWGLSPRELEVLRRLAAGADTRDVAVQLGISHTTARNHAQSLLRKLGVHSRIEAISLAFRHQLV